MSLSKSFQFSWPRLLLGSIALLCIWFPWGAAAGPMSAPNISGNALFLYRNSSLGNDHDAIDNRNGIDLQEAELAFSSDVDPYSPTYDVAYGPSGIRGGFVAPGTFKRNVGR